MSKKFIYIATVFLVMVLIILIAFYFGTNKPTGEPGKSNVFKDFFPFGGENVENNTGTTIPEETFEEERPVNFTQKLRKITSEPVAGAGLIDLKAGTVLRYIEKATGHIFEVELFSPRLGRISNTTIPRVYDAIWGNNNDSLVTRYLKEDDSTVETYSLTVKGLSTTTENTISGIAFPSNIDQVSILGSSVFYITHDSVSSSGYISNFSGGVKKQIWSSPIKELLSQYITAKTVALTTKPEENSEGFMYFVDTGTGGVRKILGNIFGLSTLVSSDASQVLYLNQGGVANMNLHNIKNKTTIALTPTTFPEKCVWSTKDTSIVYCAVPRFEVERGSLTMWYKGMVSYMDDIWKYDLKNVSSDLISDLNTISGENIDVIKPILSDNEQYLIFINKKDNSLWSLDLTK